ncbi:MAG: hypothetical protein OXT65_02950 [Alphaproteobacteria bacterium]|nr:hypothetical protein [Alphaproteobacteria bacterium]
MHYWNKDNFEGLKDIAENYSSQQEFLLFSRYCHFKERGLKKEALKNIEQYVSELKNKPKLQQNGIAEELCELAFFNGHVHQLIPFPLQTTLHEILKQWVIDEPSNPKAYRWLGYISGNIEFYKTALELDPNDEISITRLINQHLGDLDYQTHHLCEALFIGNIEDAKISILECEKLIKRLTDKTVMTSYTEEVESYKDLIGTWQEYKALDVKDSFPDYCQSRDKNFEFYSIVYYENK